MMYWVITAVLCAEFVCLFVSDVLSYVHVGYVSVNCADDVMSTDSAGLAVPNNGLARVLLSLRATQNFLSPRLPLR